MPQFVSDKFNVAWFKLAEFVQRKEKERALALYRLLVHSLLDPALMLQLEGDLLRAFKDEKAIELYKRAAIAYEQSGRLLEAALLYEQVLRLIPAPYELLEKMFQLYQQLGYDAHAARCAAQMVRLSREHGHEVDIF